jgi:tetratricopeptide (TPR) repeat protein
MTYFLYGNIDSARVLMRRGQEMGYAMTFLSAFFDYVARDYDAVLSKLHGPMHGSANDSISRYLLKGDAYKHMEQVDAADHCFDSAQLISERCVRKQTDGRQVGLSESRLGLALAKLGRKAEAIDHALEGTELMPVSKSFSDGTARLFDLALVYTNVGEHDLAVNLLDSLLSIPSEVSVARLKLDPQLDPLRDNPRFQALVDRGHVVF